MYALHGTVFSVLCQEAIHPYHRSLVAFSEPVSHVSAFGTRKPGIRAKSAYSKLKRCQKTLAWPFSRAVLHHTNNSGLDVAALHLEEVATSSQALLEVSSPTTGQSQRPTAGLQAAGCCSDFCVVNFYHLTDVDQPQELVSRHRRWLQDQDIKGRIYITAQGINAQLSGPQTSAHAYAKWVSEQPGFEVIV